MPSLSATKEKTSPVLSLAANSRQGSAPNSPIRTGPPATLSCTLRWGSSTYSYESASELSFAGYYRDAVGQDYANARYYSATAGSFRSPDPSENGSIGDPRTLNRYAYVGGDPINDTDPLGLCSVMVAGITMAPTPWATSAFSAEAANLGADTAYPYQGEGTASSVGSVIGQTFGPNDSTAATLAAIQYALKSNSGSIDIVAYSGGAAAFTAAYNELSAADQARIGQVLYISPGAATQLADVDGTTTVLFGSGAADRLATIGTIVPLGVPILDSGCSHTDLACLFKAAAGVLNTINSNGACNNPAVFTRTDTSGVFGAGYPMFTGGGVSPGPMPSYFQPIYYGPEGPVIGPGAWGPSPPSPTPQPLRPY